MYFVLAIVLLAILALMYMWFEAGNLKIKKIKFTRSKKGLKIIHLTDIHINLLRVKPRKVKNIIKKESPDFILMSGDYITKESDIPKFIDFLNEIKGDNTVYMCFGTTIMRLLKDKSGGLERFMKILRCRESLFYMMIRLF